MKKNIAGSLFVVSSFLCMSLFQNCSKISPEDLAQKTADAEVLAAGGPANVVENDTITEIVASDESPVSEAAEVVAEVVADVADAEPTDLVKNDDDADESVSSDADDDQDDSKALAACIEKKFKSTLTGATFSNLRGKHEIVSNQIDLISDNHGKFLVRATSADSYVRKISNHKGKIILCNVNVDSIQGGHGKIVLINSYVKEILSHKGKVKSINSTIETFAGKLKVVSF